MTRVAWLDVPFITDRRVGFAVDHPDARRLVRAADHVETGPIRLGREPGVLRTLDLVFDLDIIAQQDIPLTDVAGENLRLGRAKSGQKEAGDDRFFHVGNKF